MKRPTEFGPRLLSCFHKLASVEREHGDRNGVAQRLLYHGLVFAQAEGLFFRAAGAYAIADAQFDELLDVFPADISHDPADSRKGDLVRVGKEHMPADQGLDRIDSFT